MTAHTTSRREEIRSMLADLKLPGALEAIDKVLSQADGGHVTASEAIHKLLKAQVTLRNDRRLVAAMRSSRLPCVKTLEDFDFSFQPSIKREQIDSLHELGFVQRVCRQHISDTLGRYLRDGFCFRSRRLVPPGTPSFCAASLAS